jgi:hypothetical protein
MLPWAKQLTKSARRRSLVFFKFSPGGEDPHLNFYRDPKTVRVFTQGLQGLQGEKGQSPEERLASQASASCTQAGGSRHTTGLRPPCTYGAAPAG